MLRPESWPPNPTNGAVFVILSPVQVLYGLLILCVAAMIWTAVAVTRHIVRHRREQRAHAEHHDEHHDEAV